MSDRAAGRVPALALLGGLVLLLATLAGVKPASAHAYLTTSDPANSALVAVPPSQVAMTFSERLEPSVSRADLYDQSGGLIAGTSFTIPDPFTMLLSVPPGLGNGTYAVVWTSLSADDGHTASGFLSFTVGTESDIATVVLPELANSSAPPAIVTTIARGITYLGLAILIGIWPVWLLVVRPALGPVWQLGPDAVRRARRLMTAGLGLAVGGSVMALVLQGVATGDGLLPGLRATLLETRFGTLWWLRVGLLGALGALLASVAPWWFPRRRQAVAIGLTGLGPVAVLPFSLISHANAQPVGRAAAIASDLVHAVAASLWIGGVITLVVVFLPVLRSLSAAGRQVVLTRAIPRFSTVALSAWAALALTGFYAGWLEIGNLTALFDTGYGTTLILKLAAIVVILVIAAFNLLVLTRRLRRVATVMETDRWSSVFRYLLVAELVFGLVVLGLTGSLTSSQPARDVLDQRSGQIIVPVRLGDRSGSLGLAPGASGLNHFQLRLNGEQFSPATRAILRVGLPTAASEPGDIILDRIGANTFEWHGSEIAVPGDWSIEIIVRQPGASDLTERFIVPIGSAPPDAGAPGAPPRFTSVGISALILILASVVGLVIALGMGHSATRRETAGLSAVGLAVGIVMLFQGEIDPALSAIPTTNPVPSEAQSVAAGQNLWVANCLSCHGASGGGDGPAAAELTQPPPDLTAPHQQYHTDQELYYSISNGIAGTGMPAFGDRLGSTDIWNLINYLHVLQGRSASVARTATDVVAASGDSVADPPGPFPTSGSRACAVGPATDPSVGAAGTGLIATSRVPGSADEAVACEVAVRPSGSGTTSIPVEWAGVPTGGSSGATPSAGVPPGETGGA